MTKHRKNSSSSESSKAKKVRGSRGRNKYNPRNDEVCFIPTRHNRDEPVRELSERNYWMDLAHEINDYNFQQPTVESIATLQKLMGSYRSEGLSALSLGRYGYISYSLAPKLLSTGSLNSESDTMEESKKEIFVELKFINASTKEQVMGALPKGRFALVLGRLKATHHPHDFARSHWIVVLDQTRLLWALYANDVDEEDVHAPDADDQFCKLHSYQACHDTAFGADRVGERAKKLIERVVLLGGFGEMSFNSGEEMTKVHVYALDWSAAPASAVVMPVLATLTLSPKVAAQAAPGTEGVGDQMDLN